LRSKSAKTHLALIFIIFLYCLFVFIDIAHTISVAQAQTDRQYIIVSICDVQGNWFTSPYLNQSVVLQGIVYADFDQKSYGFYIQDTNCDHDPNTSDGIFVYIGGNQQVVNVGDKVWVFGTIQEYYGKTEISTSPEYIQIIAQNRSLPTPVELSPPSNDFLSDTYFESLESMYVSMDQATVVGPTNASGESWLVRQDLGISRVFHDDPSGTGHILCVDDRGLYEINPQVKVGDQVSTLIGALDYTLGVYRLQLSASPTVTQTSLDPFLPPSTTVTAPAIKLATFNLANLFDTYDDPEKDDTVLSNPEYQRRLQKRALLIHNVLGEPDLLAVQEAENRAVLEDLVARTELEADYGIVWMDTPDTSGMDIALLYRLDRVAIIERSQHQGCTQLQDGLGPDGNGDIDNPVNLLTCDRDGDQENDGNRLFSRPPQVVQLSVYPTAGAGVLAPTSSPIELFLINNHWKSKVEDTAVVQFTLPRRQEQAQFVAALAQDILASQPTANLVVLGDLNDHPDSAPLSTLTQSGFFDTSLVVPKPHRFSYNYHGISQVLDYVLFRLQPNLALTQVSYFPFNADYPSSLSSDPLSVHRSSDHDPLLVTISVHDHLNYLPLNLLSSAP
jgi:predicted extracellular nuclease